MLEKMCTRILNLFLGVIRRITLWVSKFSAPQSNMREPISMSNLDTNLGEYYPDRFFGKIPILKLVPDEQNLRSILVVTHEYFHYLQNISTPYGFFSFVVSQELLVHFSKTMSPDNIGVSLGSSLLDFQQQERVAKLISIKTSNDGDDGPYPREKESTLRFKVNKLDGRRVYVTMKWQGTYKEEEGVFLLGAHAIKESMSSIIERRIEEKFRETEAELNHERTVIPDFPYRILEGLMAYICGDISEPPVVTAALGMLSLMTTQPGLEIVSLMKDYSNFRTENNAPIRALQLVAQSRTDKIAEDLKKALIDLEQIENMHDGRGASDKAFRYILSIYQKGLRRRLTEPLFDVEPFLSDELSYLELMRELSNLTNFVPPCDFMVENGTKFISFVPQVEDECGLSMSQYTKCFAAQQAFCQVHIDYGTRRFIPTNQVTVKPCVYFAMCTHPYRLSNGDICLTKPWLHYKPGFPDCWYTSGIASTLGRLVTNRYIVRPGNENK